ncbi:metal-sensitive transcriptional regulator [Peptostreptococcus equinus]|uniref:Metal-sensitive transcriptional regulator n=1 Tax=Peptostreptococcus equinus TaxID=3003601 RepID=A0ABY7JUC1_9FIRM|nr:metal-sensitive transcriptional regulator [Peptostreptococcus sp. CBA3647]WAW15570.1 metal-sensitive transcriptional regulator [Peptostreptococcus sp. CBA3647]
MGEDLKEELIVRKLNPNNDRRALIRRLKKIEGQIKGIQNMVEEERYCIDILNQISAVKSAMSSVGNIILSNHISGCVSDAIENNEADKDKMIKELIDMLNKYSR